MKDTAMGIHLPVIAGVISTVLFASSTLPMVLKAYRTKDLKSYSLGYLLLSNVGNVFYSIYVFDMPPGPIWLLHTFYLFTTGLMLVWYLRYERLPALRQRRSYKDTGSEQAPQRNTHNHMLTSKPKYPVELPH
jgi:uncharacterized protein with PQ loop repeat